MSVCGTRLLCFDCVTGTICESRTEIPKLAMKRFGQCSIELCHQNVSSVSFRQKRVHSRDVLKYFKRAVQLGRRKGYVNLPIKIFFAKEIKKRKFYQHLICMCKREVN